MSSWYFNKDVLKEHSSAYLSSLSRSLCLALDEFYKDLRYVFCSAYTGEGLAEVQGFIPSLAQEYTEIHFADLEDSLKNLSLAKEKSMEKAKEQFNNDIH